MNMRGLYRCRAFCFDVMRGTTPQGVLPLLIQFSRLAKKSGPNE
jgi:hypothetical protein